MTFLLSNNTVIGTAAGARFRYQDRGSYTAATLVFSSARRADGLSLPPAPSPAPCRVHARYKSTGRHVTRRVSDARCFVAFSTRFDNTCELLWRALPAEP